MTITIRDYRDLDAVEVGRLIADTYREFNLSFASPEELKLYLGPFQYARSSDAAHQAAIAAVVWSEMCYVADANGEIAGVLRGRKERLASLFVRKDYHRQGVGRELVLHFEAECANLDVSVIRVAATVYAVPFYSKLGYKKSTGLRTGWSFDGYGLPIQPMKKVLAKKPD